MPHYKNFVWHFLFKQNYFQCERCYSMTNMKEFQMQENHNFSPCDGNCQIDSLTNYCVSCFRTMNEIINWINYSEKEKIEVLKKIENRKELLKKNSNK